MKFSKSYEPNQYEPDIYALWESSNAFKPREEGDPYTIVMPPPNANGNLHIGHGLTIAVEDVLIRYRRLKGDRAWYIPGADHAGFETWVVYERLLEKEGKSRFDYTRDELYEQVWDFVAKQRGSMELQLRALGASCDWSAQTFTLDPKVTTQVYTTFKKMWDESLIYRGKKLVNYCTKHQTAFADIEVEYHDTKTPLYYIKYGPFTLATTRPETKFGDTAVAVHPNDERYKKYVGETITVEGVNGPFEVKCIADDYVDPSFGTGVVKITPAHDFNDFEVGQRHNLEAVEVITKDGKLNERAGRFAGMTVEEGRKAIVKAMKEKGLIEKIDENYVNRTGVCYKCKTVIEPMLMEQWFINTDSLAQRAIDALKANRIKFHPASKKKVLINYLKNLKDWNISRQIPWGIPIPAFHDEEGNWIFDERIDKEEIVVENTTYHRDEDTFDTWFSSGQWPFITTNYKENPETPFYPTSVMETAADILFQWVARMIMLGLYMTDEVPFKDVYLHGLVLDEHGIKMSKSKGNVINPMEIISEYGSDALRLGLISSRSAGINQAFSAGKVVASRNLCNKLWNISRLIQSFVDENENKNKDETKVETLNMGEDWICRELENCRKDLDRLIGNYRFAEAAEILYDTIWNKYADWFLESQKIYKNLPLLKKTLENILIMLHPFAPFVTETIWQSLSWTENLLITEEWPGKLSYDPITAELFETIIIIVSETRTALQGLELREKPNLTFGSSSLIDDHQVLIQFLTKVKSVTPTDNPRGLRLSVKNLELYLDITDEELKTYKTRLEERILSLGREIDTLNLRLTNPNYIKKAPKELVEETKNQLEEKEAALSRLRSEQTLI